MQKKSVKIIWVFVLMVGFWSCDYDTDEAVTQVELKPVTGDNANKGIEANLFDGFSMAGWHSFNKNGEVKNWIVEDSALVCPVASKDAVGGDIVSDNEYGDFELSWQWKASGGASGAVMYHVIESPKYSAAFETGPGYRLNDDIGFSHKQDNLQLTGADYAMHPANSQKKIMSVDGWNLSKIVFRNGSVEHWLNGEKVLDFQAWDDKWNNLKNLGKWKGYPDYGMAKKGKIAMRVNTNKVYFKHITIKEL
jgi:hypothetical protein